MSLIGVSLNDVFIKFAHMEIPLFNVSHFLHYGSSLFVFSFSIGLAHCPTLCKWGSLIPQVAFASIGSVNPGSLQAEAKIGQMEGLLHLIFNLECAHQIAISTGGRSRS